MRSHDDRGFEQVAAVLREDLAGARLADLVARRGRRAAGRARPNPATRRARRDRPCPCRCRARGSTSRRSPRSRPAFSSDSTCTPLLARQRTVVRAHELFARELVEVRGEPLGHAARVAEHDRGAVRADQLEDARVHVRPDARCSARARRGRARRRRRRPARAGCAPGSFMSSTGTITSTSSALREPASTIVTGRGPSAVWPPRKRAISSSGRWVAERPMRCGGRVGDRFEPFERQHQVRAALRRRERVDLVDDHVLDQRSVSRACDVSIRYSDSGVVMRMSGGVARRAAGVPCPACRRCASRPWACANVVAEALGRERDAGERRAQVLLDVERERAQRRDVEHAAAPVLRRLGRGAEPVDRPEERGERLARAGRREHQACGRRLRSRASPGPGRRWARRTWSRTTPALPGRRARATPRSPYPEAAPSKSGRIRASGMFLRRNLRRLPQVTPPSARGGTSCPGINASPSLLSSSAPSWRPPSCARRSCTRRPSSTAGPGRR